MATGSPLTCGCRAPSRSARQRALGFSPEERASAEDQDWLYYGDDEESVLDGPLRMWRYAAKCGLGLCGVSVVIY
ncbi:hypothetical protein [Streptomyces violascens]|uniref:hypothetical protein n=1 Tax=Streptomyces violascens TaxID=67381 RepID=UPI00368E5600